MANGCHILFVGGGSLGHIYPGISIAHRLRERLPAAQMTFVGDNRPIERHTVNGAGYRYTSIPCGPRPYGVISSLRHMATTAAGSCASLWLLGELKTSLVVGLGGHASASMLRSAQARGIPTLVVEQNCQPDPATRRLSRKANTVCLAFDETRPHLPVETASIVTGVPGRPPFERLPPRRPDASKGPKRLVIVGGAGGAQGLNESAAAAIARNRDAVEGWQIVHQTGTGRLVETERRYREAGVSAVVVTYIDEMADLLREADLVVCRSGGCTLAELALSGAPGLLVPDKRLPDNSQTANARLAEAAGGCRVVDEQAGPLEGSLSRELADLLKNDFARAQMSGRIAQAARRDASAQIADLCCEALEVRASAPRLARAA